MRRYEELRLRSYQEFPNHILDRVWVFRAWTAGPDRGRHARAAEASKQLAVVAFEATWCWKRGAEMEVVGMYGN